MKFDTFTRTIPWYEITPTSGRFIYKDKVTKLYFVILSGSHRELQGAGYHLATAYRRLQEACYKTNEIVCPPLDNFELYENLQKEMVCKVRA